MELTGRTSPKWRIVGRSVRGSSHERAGGPNQDALGWLPREDVSPFVILALSDGHGSAKSFRSEIGSRFAVDVSIREMQSILADSTMGVEDKLSKSLVEAWRKEVSDHLAKNPFTSQEREQLREKDGESAVEAVRRNVFLAYGATVLGLIVTEQSILYLQLGDGDILVVGADGKVTRPVPKDERLFANQTTSLCSPNAWKDFRVCFQEVLSPPPALILLATDGYANSFSDECGFLQVGTDLSRMICDSGWETVSDKLEGWLSEASREGSGDDITVGLVAPALLSKEKSRERIFLDFVPWVSTPKK